METQSDWFKEWFNTPYYHTLYKHRDHKEAERFIKNLIAFLNINKNAKCLDLACGKGRHAEQLCNHGFKVIGLDLSENSINAAKKLEKKNLNFDVHDMREVYKSEKFDAIFNLFTSFGYFDNQSDNLKMLRSVKEMLNENGLFIMDFMNVNKVVKNLVSSEVKTIDGIDFIINRKTDGAHIYKNIQFEDKGEKFNYTERVQALTKENLFSIFSDAKFKIKHTFGDFDLNPFDENQSNRLIIVAEK